MNVFRSSLYCERIQHQIVIPWILRRISKVIKLLLFTTLIFLCIYFLVSAAWYSQRERVHATDTSDSSVRQSSSVLPPQYWVVVDSEDLDLCDDLSNAFSSWVILFATNKTVDGGSCMTLPVSDSGSVRGNVLKSAFLFAVSHSARVVYVARPDDIQSFKRLSVLGMTSGNHTRLIGVTSDSRRIINLERHYGCSHRRSSFDTENEYHMCDTKTAVFVPALFDQDLHKDAVCDITAPLLTVGSGSYVKTIATNSVYLRDAFWAFPAFSVEKSYRVWGYVVQWLLQKIGSRITVFWNGMQRPSDVVVSDSDQPVLDLLSGVECNNSGNFSQCLDTVIFQLIEAKYIPRMFHVEMRTWFEQLVGHGYHFPNASLFRGRGTFDCTNPERVVFSAVNYSVQNSSNRSRTHLIPISNLNASFALHRTTCSKVGTVNVTTEKQRVDISRPWKQFKSVVLVITFNKPHYEVIPHVELLYRSYFPRIVYCGPQFDSSIAALARTYEISFITYSDSVAGNISGALSYQCACKVADMNYQTVSGYLFMSDDVLLFPSSLRTLNLDRVWYIPQKEIRIGDLNTLRECHIGMCDFYARWNWWETYKTAAVTALETLNAYRNVSILFAHCLSELKRLNGNELSRANGGYSDIFYLPNHLMKDFSTLAGVFLKSEVFLEIAVPTVLRCLELPDDIQPLHGKQIWDLTRDEPWTHFRRENVFNQVYFHPAKWSNITKSAKLRDFYCNNVLPYVFDPFMQL